MNCTQGSSVRNLLFNIREIKKKISDRAASVSYTHLFALDLIITFILSKLNVEKANAEIKEKLGTVSYTHLDQIEAEFDENLNWECSKSTGTTRSIVIEEKACLLYTSRCV